MTAPLPSSPGPAGRDSGSRERGRSWRAVMSLRWAWTRVLLVLGVSAATLMLMAAWLDGVHVATWGDAFLAALTIAVVNAILWPLLTRFALAVFTLTLGLGALLLNAVVLVGIASALPGFSIDSFWDGFLITLGLTIASTLVNWVFSLEDDDVWYRGVVARRARKLRGEAIATDVPGVIFLQIDGLGYDVLRRAIRNGDAPTMAAWIAQGAARMMPWHTDLSSQTGASQCGILMGSNVDMPAFRWYEKSSSKLMVSNLPKDAAEIERRHSTGFGLLHADGVSRNNLFTGDAEESILTMSVAAKKRGRIGNGYQAYFVHPHNTARTLVATVSEIFRELRASSQQKRRNVRPRVHRGGVYPFLRAFTTIISRDVIVATVSGDMLAGRSVVYADLLGYDEVAHHSGLERNDSLAVLRGIDTQIARLAKVAQEAPRPYHLVILSDHGQSQGAPFRDEYGITLEDLVRTACGLEPLNAPRAPAGAEAWGQVGEAVTEIGSGEGTVARTVRKRTGADEAGADDGAEVVLGAEAARTSHAEKATKEGILVLGSGSAGLVYFTDIDHRLTLEEIEESFPQLLPALASHPGIGMVMTHSAQQGPVILGPKGSVQLRSMEVTGEDPLAVFGPYTASGLLRTDGFTNAPDLFIASIYDPQMDEVHPFEDFVGSHGGLGGEQTTGFVIHPTGWREPEAPVVGAGALHELLTGWLADLGQPAWVARRQALAAEATAEPAATS